jgi:dihydrofolate reductase
MTDRIVTTIASWGTDDTSGEFRFGGWAVPHWDDTVHEANQNLFSQPFELVLGRRTYDIFASYFPGLEAGHPVGDVFNRVPKHVATHTPDTLDWQNSRALDAASACSATTLGRRRSPWWTRRSPAAGW